MRFAASHPVAVAVGKSLRERYAPRQSWPRWATQSGDGRKGLSIQALLAYCVAALATGFLGLWLLLSIVAPETSAGRPANSLAASSRAASACRQAPAPSGLAAPAGPFNAARERATKRLTALAARLPSTRASASGRHSGCAGTCRTAAHGLSAASTAGRTAARQASCAGVRAPTAPSVRAQPTLPPVQAPPTAPRALKSRRRVPPVQAPPIAPRPSSPADDSCRFKPRRPHPGAGAPVSRVEPPPIAPRVRAQPTAPARDAARCATIAPNGG